jgi:hypothetical protein
MNTTDLNRRDFTRLSMAAFGGVIAGAAAGCSNGAAPEPGTTGDPVSNDAEQGAASAEASTTAVSLLLEEPHVCRGLNTCKGKGAGGDNACAGQGTCATAEHHACAGENECKGQGGCGGQDGRNQCKGQGGCHVPLEHGWEEVRKVFEAEMKKAGKDVGPAPAKA